MASMSLSMSGRKSPTLQQLLEALKKSHDWFCFGATLGVPVFQLKKIESDHPKNSDRCKLELLQYWLDNNLDPTWNDIILALEKTDQLALAAQIKLNKLDYLLAADMADIIDMEEGI